MSFSPFPSRRPPLSRSSQSLRSARSCFTFSAVFAAWSSAPVHGQTPQDEAPVKQLGVVVITGNGQPTTLPTQIPTTMESITRAQIERSVNANDSEDALKYFPSLLVRKRYIGDYNHAILSSRASGTGNSARSAVYADGVLLSNYLGNGVGGLSFPPRWGLVAPEEIERVDVMYGSFSAAYPGNSVGAVVVYTTRMPTAFEAHARLGFSRQPFSLYATDATYRAAEQSVSLGSRSGELSWLLSLSRADSHSQPLTFATRLLGAGSATAPVGVTPVAVSGAVLGLNNNNQPWYVIGTGTEYHTQQDQLKLKLAYDITPTLRANYLLGVWTNSAESRPVSYLRDGAGAPVYAGPISIDGRVFANTPASAQALSGADFALTRERLTHLLQGLTLKSHSGGTWDWEAGVSAYDYRKDQKRQNGAAAVLPAATNGGAGTLADGSGTGWWNAALKATWRPDGIDGAHIVEIGIQQDDYRLRYLTTGTASTGNWLSDGAAAVISNVTGETRLSSVYAQDAWAFAPEWKTVLGLRVERWRALDGATTITGASSTPPYPSRRENYSSPKAALSYQAAADLVLKASLGRAVRMPTVGELYGATATTNAQYINDPNLKPERSWTTELSAEKELGRGLLRLTWFAEDTHDSLYSQTLLDPVANRNVSRVQNVSRIQTKGAEVAYAGSDVALKGLDFNGSVTYADSVIKSNGGFVAVPGDTSGKQQPNVARWRASGLASYRVDERLTASLGARYSGPQFRTLNNADVNGFTYQGVSKFFTVDARLHWRLSRQWSAALGIDNLNNDRYWNFHPYPQRSYSVELKFDL